MGHDGRRRDADERAELCRGSVEFVATPEYQVRPPMAQYHFFLVEIPTMFANNIAPSSCGGAVIEASVAALQHTGGKVHAYLAMLPTVGVHALKLRDQAVVGDKDKMTYLASQDNTLKTLAMTAADFQVCIDVSFMAQGYCDLASFHDLTSTTGGTMYQHTPFSPMMDHDQVLNDLKWNLARLQGLEAVMLLRCSQGHEPRS
eukprot:gene28229-31330_t